MATGPKKGIKHDRPTRTSANLGAIRYPNTLRVDTNYRYHHQSSIDVDRPVQKIERARAAIESRPIKKKMKDKLKEVAHWLDSQDIPMDIVIKSGGIKISPVEIEEPLFIPYNKMGDKEVTDLDTALKLLSKVLKNTERVMTLCDIDGALEEFQKENITVVLNDNWDGMTLVIEAVPSCESILDRTLTSTIDLPATLTQTYFEENIVPQIKERFAKFEKVLEAL